VRRVASGFLLDFPDGEIAKVTGEGARGLNVVRPIGSTSAITVERFGHDPATPHRDPERERASGHAVNFVCTGSFRVKTRDAWRTLTRSSLLVTTPGFEFSCAHDEEFPHDECLTIAYSEAAIDSLRSAGAAPADASVVALSNRHAYLRHGIESNPAGDATRLEALAGALYWTLGAPSDALGGQSGSQRLYRPHQLSWYAARIDRAKEMMRAQFADALSLSQLASGVGMSLYSFARLFSELEGETPHRYLVDIRLREAARQLREGARVTEVSAAVGFGSLSHFIQSFRRRYGVPPSRFRRASAAAKREPA
jgi:AraC family transcriptional regulator